MADDIQKENIHDGASEALKGDIAKILADVKLPETPTEQLSRAMADSHDAMTKAVEDVGLVRPQNTPPKITQPMPQPTSSVSIPITAPPKPITPLTIQATRPAATPAIPVPTVESPVIKKSSIPAIVEGDIAHIIQETKLPEAREVHLSGDIPKVQVMPHEPPPVMTALAGSKEAQDLREKIDPSLKPGPSAEKPPAKDTIVTPLRTLKDDMSTIVQSSKISLIRAASLEAEKKSKVEHSTSVIEMKRSQARTRHTLGTLFAIIMFFGVGAAALFGVYTISNLQHNTQQATASASSILFAERTLSLNIDNQTPEQIKQTIAQALTTSNSAVGSITRIMPILPDTTPQGAVVQRPVTLREFLTALGAHAPNDLLRALSDSFFFGIHTVNKNVPIIVVPVVSYSRAFAGMLTWEPQLNSDFVPIFSPVPTETRDENGLPVLRSFQSAVMNNYDVRELKDDSGNVVMYYSFPTTKILVIAESPYSFVEILSRLQAGRSL